MESRSSSSKVVENYAIVPPDGGWGWVIVAAAFYCNMVIDGILSTFGIFMDYFVEEYKKDEAMISFIGSLMFGSHLMSGPICNALITTFGIRPMAVLGSIFATISLSVPAFSENLVIVYVFFAVFGGMAMCFVHVGSMTSVMVYFSRFRIRAIGIVICGSGAGQFLLAIMSSVLLNYITWRQVLLVRAGLVFLMGFVSLVYVPLRPARITITSQVPLNELRESTESIGPFIDSEENEPNEKVILFESKRRESAVSAMSRTDLVLKQFVREYHGPHNIFGKCAERFNRICCFCCCRQRDQRAKVLFIHPSTHRDLTLPIKNTALSLSSTAISSEVQTRNYERIRIINRSDPLPFWRKLAKSFEVLVDFGILRNPLFVFFCLSSGLSSSAITIIYTYEPGRAEQLGLSSFMMATLTSSLGASSLFWRIFLTAISSFPHINYHALHILTLCLGGVAVIISSLSDSLYFQFFCSILCGLGTASFAIFRPVLLLEIVGLSNVSKGLGVCLLFMGVLASVGPPTAGLLKLLRDGYEPTFWLAGVMLLTSSFILIIITGRGRRRVRFDPEA